jgi:hypothetical protein
MRTNDTVLHQLKLELETVCSNTPRESASTMFAVDGEYTTRHKAASLRDSDDFNLEGPVC